MSIIKRYSLAALFALSLALPFAMSSAQAMEGISQWEYDTVYSGD
tara:strand:+ start:838 stop:972 length:135 start_codon:yes stop_codon:yes gene_type:complete